MRVAVDSNTSVKNTRLPSMRERKPKPMNSPSPKNVLSACWVVTKLKKRSLPWARAVAVSASSSACAVA